MKNEVFSEFIDVRSEINNYIECSRKDIDFNISNTKDLYEIRKIAKIDNKTYSSLYFNSFIIPNAYLLII